MKDYPGDMEMKYLTAGGLEKWWEGAGRKNIQGDLRQSAIRFPDSLTANSTLRYFRGRLDKARLKPVERDNGPQRSGSRPQDRSCKG